ncbi:MAG: hypothetical protein Fur0032_13060 [Terrimicrobiaceae bacterium]
MLGRLSQAQERLSRAGIYGQRLVLASGDVTAATVELSNEEERVDHVWIFLDCGIGEPVTVSVNTTSRKSALAGFDPRLRFGKVTGHSQHMPPRGLKPLARFDYSEIEQTQNVFYEHLERVECEERIIGLAQAADRVEAWGAPYRRRGEMGLHQIHSRRRSCAVPEDVTGFDGGLKFYRRGEQEIAWTMILIKFCGQP